jgi:sterol desaturase/sphingolipid hydroxylase (fatty acid hydroxylase superfamily)
MLIVFCVFVLLVGCTAMCPARQAMSVYSVQTKHSCSSLAHSSRFGTYQTKPVTDWIVDGAGLCVQGILIPLLQITLMHTLWSYGLLGLEGSWHLGMLPGFFLSVVGVDYFYYWNHRLLHGRSLWNIHCVHHTVTEMDVLGTSRNTLWSSVFIIYLWIHGLMIYLLADPGGYVMGVSVSSALDLWRHSRFSPTPGSWIEQLLSPWLILPADHARHHRRDAAPVNFGANFKLWDRLHHTYDQGDRPSDDLDRLGIPSQMSLLQKLVFPLSAPSSNK